MYVRAHCLPLTRPPSTSAAAPPPPPHTIVGIDVCCTQCWGRAVCCDGRLAERAGGRLTGVNRFASNKWLKQATVQNTRICLRTHQQLIACVRTPLSGHEYHPAFLLACGQHIRTRLTRSITSMSLKPDRCFKMLQMSPSSLLSGGGVPSF